MGSLDYSYFNRFLGSSEVQATKRRAAERLRRDPDSSISLLDPETDQAWASMNQWSSAINSYYNYFFMGEDMRVYMAQTADDPEFGDMPIAGVGFNIQQQKTPVYGFWSETYDAVMRGSRLVEGQLMIYSKGPDYMKRALSRAAHNRKNTYATVQDKYPVPQSWREDDQNLEKYWSQTLDPAARLTKGNIFSIHPPFDLIFVFGKQNTSMEDELFDASDGFEGDTPLYVDTNQRLVEGHNQFASRMILAGCEITDMSTTIQPNSFVLEQYSFFAKDLVVPRSPSQSTAPPRSGSGGINNTYR